MPIEIGWIEARGIQGDYEAVLDCGYEVPESGTYEGVAGGWRLVEAVLQNIGRMISGFERGQ